MGTAVGHKGLSLTVVGEVVCFPLPSLPVQQGRRGEKGLKELMGEIFTWERPKTSEFYFGPQPPCAECSQHPTKCMLGGMKCKAKDRLCKWKWVVVISISIICVIKTALFNDSINV